MTRPRHLLGGVMECDVIAVVAESECEKVTDFFVYLAEMFVQWLRQRRAALDGGPGQWVHCPPEKNADRLRGRQPKGKLFAEQFEHNNFRIQNKKTN